MEFLLWIIVLESMKPIHGLDNISKNAFRNTSEIVRSYGYPVETHTVTTEDGYLLTLFRISSNLRDSQSDSNRKVVLIQHGITGSSDDWVQFGPSRSLGFLMAESGYDVWLGNDRGNIYSQTHRKLTRADKRYWDYSFHEIGYYDLPAVIDYILQITEEEKLYYVGHSMGTTSCFVLCSTRPEYNQKLASIISIAPVVFLANTNSPLARRVGQKLAKLKAWSDKYRVYEYPARKNKFTCQGNGRTAASLFENNFLFIAAGYKQRDIDQSIVPVLLGHSPAGTSIKTLEHFAQEIQTGKFQKFDYGPAENIRRYSQEEPPQYELNKVTALVSIIYSDGDIISTTQDVEAFYSSLPATFSKVLVGGGTFKHFDAVVGREARLLVHQEVVKLLQLVGDSETPLFDLNSDTTDIVIINFLPEMSEEKFDED